MSKDDLFQKLNGESIRCLACNHYCRISQGKTGICGVRQNRMGELRLLVDNKVASLNIDPIEKKPLYHFLPGTKIMSFGTYGCNFRCSFCQNFDISQSVKDAEKQNDQDKIIDYGQKITSEEIVDLTLKNKLPSIAYTYNEPTVFCEFALRTMKLARKAHLKNVWVSNGFMSKETLRLILPYLDAVNLDLKSFSDRFYLKICGGRLKPVLNNIESLFEAGVHLELTTLLIPGLNDSETELKQMADFIKSLSPKIPWHLSRFFPSYQMLDRLPTALSSLKKTEEIGKKAGLKYIYLGNI